MFSDLEMNPATVAAEYSIDLPWREDYDPRRRFKRMKNSAFKLLLVAIFAFWATGLAQYTHEMVEHVGPQRAADKLHTSSNSSHSQQHHSDSDDDCPTCAMFASMAAGPIAVPLIVGPPQRVVPAPALRDHLAPTAPLLQVHRSRAPPL